MTRPLAAVRLACALALVVVAAPSPSYATTPVVADFSITVDGETAAGRIVVPAALPTVLVVFCHGYGGSGAYFDEQLADVGRRGYAGVAMDYRGPAAAWKVRAGWRDTVAATLELKRRYPTIQNTIIWGISMGGEVSGLSVAYAPPGTFQYWVEDAGVTNLAEEWAILPDFRHLMQAETGGTPAEVPQAYADRSPALQIEGIAAQGLRRAYLNHGAGDPVVVMTQVQEMTASLAAARVPVSTYTYLGLGHVGGWGYAQVLEKATGQPDWAAPVVQGVIGPVGFMPAVSPPA